MESTKSIKIRMPEQSNDYRVVTFGSGGVGKSSLGKRLKVVLDTYSLAQRESFSFVFTAVIHPRKVRVFV